MLCFFSFTHKNKEIEITGVTKCIIATGFRLDRYYKCTNVVKVVDE